MSRIIRVEPTTPMIALTWMIGSRCNYSCMYCPEEWHDMTSTHADLEKLKAAWHSFYEKTKHLNLPYKVGFTGGEATANKALLPIVQYLKANYNIGQLIISTNGSASKNYYLKLAEFVDSISFTIHSEFFNEQEFFDKIIAVDKVMIRPQKSIHVNIMDEYWNQDRIKLYQQHLTKHNISHSINSVNYSKQYRDTPDMKGVYNLEQI